MFRIFWISYAIFMGFVVCVTYSIVSKHLKIETPLVKHELNFTPQKADVFVSEALGECDSAGTETTKTVDTPKIQLVPVSDNANFVEVKECKIFGLTVWKSEKMGMD